MEELNLGWQYNPQFEEGSREADTLSKLVKGIDWI